MKKTLRLALPVALLSAVLSACGSSNVPDTVKPTVNLTTLSAVTQGEAVTLEAIASDNKAVKEVDFYVDDVLVQQVTTPTNGVYQATYRWQSSQNGTHIVKAVATDTSNNVSDAATQRVTVNLETLRPTVTITTTAPDPVTRADSYTLAVSATDNVGVVSMTGNATCTDVTGKTTTLLSPSTTTKTSFEYALPVTAAYNGSCTLSVSAADAAGNVGSATRTININISGGAVTPPAPGGDTVRPVVTITSPSTITAAGNYQVSVTATDNVGVTSLSGVLNLPNGNVIPLTFAPEGGTQSIPVSAAYNGTSVLKVTATDAAGNSGAATQQIVVNIR